MKIKIYADGADIKSIKSLNSNSLIEGFTTNPTLMKQENINDYKDFAKIVLDVVKVKPVSFEVFEDDLDLMYRQAKEIHSWGNNINIKIPIQNTKSQYCFELIKTLCDEGMHCNVTAVFTTNQIDGLLNVLDEKSKFILSIFAGRIADTGVDPIPIVEKAVKNVQNYKNAEILWASPREPLNIIQADKVGCHIITLTPVLIDKMKNFGKDLELFSLETVKMFYDDAKSSKFNLKI